MEFPHPDVSPLAPGGKFQDSGLLWAPPLDGCRLRPDLRPEELEGQLGEVFEAYWNMLFYQASYEEERARLARHRLRQRPLNERLIGALSGGLGCLGSLT